MTCDIRSVFTARLVNFNDDWIDITIVDTCRNGNKRDWQFSYNTRTKQYYAVLYRSNDEDKSYERVAHLPKKMVEVLLTVAAPQLAVWRLTQ